MSPPTLLASIKERLARHGTRPRLLMMAAMLALLALAASSADKMIPRNYQLTLTGGGDITSNRHLLAKGLQEAATARGVALALRTTGGSQEALALVAAGKLDFAFVQGGAELPHPALVHVATVVPELLHFVVRPGITTFAGLRGKKVNLGSKSGGTRLVAGEILKFAGLRADIDFVEANLSTEQLLTLRSERLPDAIVVTSFLPSLVVDHLVRQHGYTLLDVPFSTSFALRHPWATDSKIPVSLYQVEPHVPPRAIQTIGMNLRLVANRHVDRHAVFKVLESLFGPRLEARLRLQLDERTILASAVHPPSEGTRMFMERNNPLFAYAMLDKLKAGVGLLVSVFSAVLVIIKWVRATPPAAATSAMCDQTLIDYLGQVSSLETAFRERVSAEDFHVREADELDAKLAAIKATALDVLSKRGLNDPHLPHSLLLSISGARTRIARLRMSHDLRWH